MSLCFLYYRGYFLPVDRLVWHFALSDIPSVGAISALRSGLETEHRADGMLGLSSIVEGRRSDRVAGEQDLVLDVLCGVGRLLRIVVEHRDESDILHTNRVVKRRLGCESFDITSVTIRSSGKAGLG